MEKRGIRFTELWLKNASAPAKGQKDFYDSSKASPHGFGLRVSQGGSKTFFLMYSRDKKRHRWTIGRYPEVSLKGAREQALRRSGNKDDPATDKRRARKLGDFRSLAEKYLAAKKRELRPASAVEYERILNKVIEEFGDTPAAKIERRDLREYLNAKAAKTPFMANRFYEVLRAVYNRAREDEWVETSPCDRLKRPVAEEPSRERHLATAEIRRVWSAIEKERPMMAVYFKLLFYTAVRRSEGTTARWSDIDLEKRLWRIPVTKNKKPHELPLSDQVVSLLHTVWPLTGHTEHIFIGPNGKALANPQKAKQRIEKRSGVEFRSGVPDSRHSADRRLGARGARRLHRYHQRHSQSHGRPQQNHADLRALRAHRGEARRPRQVGAPRRADRGRKEKGHRGRVREIAPAGFESPLRHQLFLVPLHSKRCRGLKLRQLTYS